MNIINLTGKPILFKDADDNQLMIEPAPDFVPMMPIIRRDEHGYISTSEGVQIPVYRNYVTGKTYEEKLSIPDPKPDTIYVLHPATMWCVGNMVIDDSRDDIFIPNLREGLIIDETTGHYILTSRLYNVHSEADSGIIPRFNICKQTTDIVMNNVTNIVNFSSYDYKFVNAAIKGRETILYAESNHKHMYRRERSHTTDEKIVNVENVNFTLVTFHYSPIDVSDLLPLISDERPDTIYLMPKELCKTRIFSIFKNRNDIFIPTYAIKRGDRIDTSKFFGGVKTLGNNDEFIFEVNSLVSAFRLEIKN